MLARELFPGLLDGTAASAAKAAAEFTDKSMELINSSPIEPGEVGKVIVAGGKAGTAYKKLNKTEKVPVFKVTITVQHELRPSSTKQPAAPTQEALMNALGGRTDPRYQQVYLDGMGGLLGSGKAQNLTMFMLGIEINF